MENTEEITAKEALEVVFKTVEKLQQKRAGTKGYDGVLHAAREMQLDGAILGTFFESLNLVPRARDHLAHHVALLGAHTEGLMRDFASHGGSPLVQDMQELYAACVAFLAYLDTSREEK